MWAIQRKRQNPASVAVAGRRTKLIARFINEGTRLVIPDAHRMLAIEETTFSTSLRHALTEREIHYAAELQGLTWLDVAWRLRLSLTHARELFDTYAVLTKTPRLEADDAADQGDWSVRNLDLSRRAVNVLWANGIRTVAQLTTVDYERAMGFRNCGKKTASEILDCLEQLNAGTHPRQRVVEVTPAGSTIAESRDDWPGTQTLV